MVTSTVHQAWLFYSPLAQQAALLKDDLLDPVDQLLDDPALVDLVRHTGRDGMAPDRLLRCCIMKHLKGWSFRDLERELRSNLVYRRFTHFDAETTPDFTTFTRIDEVENGIVSGYQVLAGNPEDSTSWMPALEQHQAGFGRAPEMATGDRGFFSAHNEREAQSLGVKKVALPARGRLSAKRAEQQKQRWFRRALRWRAGIEATISTLKHPFSMWRATYRGGLGFERYVGWCVITKNLFSIARDQARRRSHGQVG